MAKKFASLITEKGKALLTAALAGGDTITLKYFAVGDGNGATITPSGDMTALVNEVARVDINSLKETDATQQVVTVEAIIPANTGGFWIREAGVFAEDGTLIAISQMPETYKPNTDDGATSTQTMRMLLAISDASTINLTVDDTLVVATEDFVNSQLAEHVKSRNHPDGTTTDKGFVQLSSATDSESETLAATPKAVKAALDKADARLEKSKNLSDLTDVAAAVKNLGLDNIDGKYTHGWQLSESGSGMHYTKLATIHKGNQTSSASFTLLVSGGNHVSDSTNQIDAVTVAYHANGNTDTLGVRCLVMQDASSSETRATYGYVVSTSYVDVYLVRPDYGGCAAVSVISGTSSRVTLFTDGTTTNEAPANLKAIATLFSWSDGHKPTATDVDAVSASDGGTFNADVSCTGTFKAKLLKSTSVVWAQGQVNYLPATQGAYLGWNRISGSGEMDFINHRGSGQGGFAFWDGNENEQAKIAGISAAGGLTLAGGLAVAASSTFSGALTIAGAGVEDSGEVRSPASLLYPYGTSGSMSVEFYGADIVNDHFECRIIVKKDSTTRYFRFKESGEFRSDGPIYEGEERVYSPNNCPFPVGNVQLFGNDVNPNDFYHGTTWEDLSAAGYDSRMLMLGTVPMTTGGSNSVTLTADNLPDHSHKGGAGAPGAAWEEGGFTTGTDNTGHYDRCMTSETFADNSGTTGISNAPIDITNAHLQLRGWMRTA